MAISCELDRNFMEARRTGNTPELLTSLWQTLWNNWGARIGLSVQVEPFPGNLEEIRAHEQKGRGAIYVPSDLSTQVQRYLLGQIWPEMKSYTIAENDPVKNEEDHMGWRWVDSTNDAPHLGYSQGQLRNAMHREGMAGMTLNEEIVGSQAHHVLTGLYFDSHTWSWVFGSRYLGSLVYARFTPGGVLDVDWYFGSGDGHPGIGCRFSVGVKRASSSGLLTSFITPALSSRDRG